MNIFLISSLKRKLKKAEALKNAGQFETAQQMYSEICNICSTTIGENNEIYQQAYDGYHEMLKIIFDKKGVSVDAESIVKTETSNSDSNTYPLTISESISKTEMSSDDVNKGYVSFDVYEPIESSENLELISRAKGDALPYSRMKVFFTCHESDFTKSFERIIEDIWKTSDCVIYYTKDLNASISEEDYRYKIGRMNLFVIPVSLKLLTEKNRAIDSDLRYAKEKHIPVLPIMIEHGIESLYSAEDKFGKLQYIDTDGFDDTGLTYEDKLNKYLTEKLLDSKTIDRVRSAFRDTVFLSYRKKDRAYADELMRMIHNDPALYDVAVWYDEYLIPGEKFDENINIYLEKCGLFLLLITPSVLELNDKGEKNYIAAIEYPSACRAEKKIVAVEAVHTDRFKLERDFKNIPQRVPIKKRDVIYDILKRELMQSCEKITETDPEHYYLIGLAYLEGINVETNKNRGTKLIAKAAEAGNIEAMKKIRSLYSEGDKIKPDYEKALYWSQKIYEFFKETYGEDHNETLKAMNELAQGYFDLGGRENCEKAVELYDKVYLKFLMLFGEKDKRTVTALNSVALTYYKAGNALKAEELLNKIYIICENEFGKNNLKTFAVLEDLAVVYTSLGDYHKALTILENIYNTFRKVFGKENDKTIYVLNKLGYTYSYVNVSKAIEIFEKTYRLCCKVYGENSLKALITLDNKFAATITMGDITAFPKNVEDIYLRLKKLLGKDHPETLMAMQNAASAYEAKGDHSTALKLFEELYSQRCRILGPEHPDTLVALSRMRCSQKLCEKKVSSGFLAYRKMVQK